MGRLRNKTRQYLHHISDSPDDQAGVCAHSTQRATQLTGETLLYPDIIKKTYVYTRSDSAELTLTSRW